MMGMGVALGFDRDEEKRDGGKCGGVVFLGSFVV